MKSLTKLFLILFLISGCTSDDSGGDAMGGDCLIATVIFTDTEVASDPEIETITFVYDNANLVTSITFLDEDGFSEALTFTYSDGLITRATWDDGETYDVTYSGSNPTTITNSDGTFTTVYNITYDSNGNLTQIVREGEFEDETRAFEYDSNGNAIRSTDDDGFGIDETAEITYDDGLNPFRLLNIPAALLELAVDVEGQFAFSTNNPIRIESEDLFFETSDVEEYSYTYNDQNYPLTATSTDFTVAFTYSCN